MHWIFLPILAEYKEWLFPFLGESEHTFTSLPPKVIVFDRSNQKSAVSSLKQWRLMVAHVLQGTRLWKPGNGYVTLFSQRPAILGALKMAWLAKRGPTVAWDFNLGSTPGGIRQFLARMMLKKTDVFVVNSTHERHVYSKWLNLPIERFYFCHYQKPRIDLGERVPADPPYIAAVGSACRDYRTLAIAAEKLRIPTVIVCAPFQAEHIPKNDYVTVKTGQTAEQCHRLIQSATIHVVPLESDETCTGHVTVAEGMWLGTPIVTSNSIGLQDYVDDGNTTLGFQSGNVDQLTEKLSLLLGDRELRDRLSRAAYQFACDHYTDEVAGRHLRTVLDRAAANHRD
ncbi:D-inositol-3-phosphate glycosyltransferase [Rubripirellula tenax]|uniref:D-inositol-3-phosphate glycosyltransferase n=1 Tax=Rubripirellula tenax TaxID=2528015 RepID=A0A5C6FBA3_9BACT|nr:glycosyltransferase [Rubripirellula tenax]TWU56881.1 D-inositol-3-phosphate glycosyltransferase [Rubripirellula tenax]